MAGIMVAAAFAVALALLAGGFGRNLDVAVRGDSWLAVQALDGTEAYTRAGSFEVSVDGTLVTRGGMQVLGDGGPIQLPPNSEPSIASDGSINARLPNGTSSVAGKLKLVTPEARLQRGSDGLFRASGGEALPADPAARRTRDRPTSAW